MIVRRTDAGGFSTWDNRFWTCSVLENRDDVYMTVCIIRQIRNSHELSAPAHDARIAEFVTAFPSINTQLVCLLGHRCAGPNRPSVGPDRYPNRLDIDKESRLKESYGKIEMANYAQSHIDAISPLQHTYGI